MFKLLSLFSFLILQGSWLSAQGYSTSELDQIRIYLHTVDVGVPIPDKYGHVQIRVNNPMKNLDLTYSFGVYDWDAPNFTYNFVKGILIYRVAVFRTVHALEAYRRDTRAVWEDEVHFTRSQKEVFLRALENHAKPENSTYRYQYFFNNCSTKPRDLFDLALNHRLHDQTVVRTTMSFREAVRIHQATTLLSGLGLEIIMNSNLDRPMSVWESMFLPKSMREVLLDYPIDPSLAKPGHQKLLSPVRMIVNTQTPRTNYRRDYVAVWIWFVAPLFLIGYFLYVFPRQRGTYLFWGFYNVLWGFIAGTFGTGMFVFWQYSEHLDLHHNANLWLLWPTDWLYVFYGLPFLFGGLPWRWLRGLTKVYASAHLLGFVFAMSCVLLGLLKQDISRTLLTVGLIMVMINVLVLVVVPKKHY